MSSASKKSSSPKDDKENQIKALPFHITFPITLIHKEGSYIKYCYFQVEDHLHKYLKRNNIKPKNFKIENTKPRNFQ